ncbi:MAG: hypothetical protein ACEY3L_13290, partial [Wolbachia sp.]
MKLAVAVLVNDFGLVNLLIEKVRFFSGCSLPCGNLNILSILSKASHLLVKGEIKQMTTRF